MGSKLTIILVCLALLTACAPQALQGSQQQGPPAPAHEAAQPAAPTQTAPATAPVATPPPAEPATAEVRMKGFAFVPASISVKPGTIITWTNEDSAQHTVTSADGSWGSDQLAQGDSYMKKFDTPGSYDYHCSIHASMRGVVVVG
jgi:plastocyanin